MTAAGLPLLSPLMRADQSVLALIMPNIRLAEAMRSAKAGDVLSGLSGLACAGKVLGVPAILYVHEDEKQFGAPAVSFDAALSENDRHRGTALDPWECESFQKTVEKLHRRQLVIGGFSTDGAVTYLAMQALQEGYDVYVLVDGCAAHTGRDHDVALRRLRQAGAVCVTIRSACAEWRLSAGEDAPPPE